MLRVIGKGRLTKDPELRALPDGTPVCEIRVAVDRMGRGDQPGFIDFCSYGNAGAAAATVLRKGWLVLLDGRLEFQEWQAGDGTRRTAHRASGHIEFLTAPLGAEEAQPPKP